MIITTLSEPSQEINDDYERFFIDALSIELEGVSFRHNSESKLYIPISGRYDVLGISVDVRGYTWSEVKKIVEGKMVNLKLRGRISGSSLFNVEEYEEIINYSDIIDELKEVGAVKTRKSESVLSTDGRLFSFDGTMWMEVDVLGTPFGVEYENRVMELWGS